MKTVVVALARLDIISLRAQTFIRTVIQIALLRTIAVMGVSNRREKLRRNDASETFSVFTYRDNDEFINFLLRLTFGFPPSVRPATAKVYPFANVDGVKQRSSPLLYRILSS